MTTDNQSLSLRMVHRLPVSPERVFDALVNPEAMNKWMFAMTFTQAGPDIADELRQVPVGEKGGSETGGEQGFEALTAALR